MSAMATYSPMEGMVRQIRDPSQILAMYEQRRRLQMPLQAVRAEIRDIYDGKTQVTLPDMPDDQQASVPNLLGQGIDQMAARVASVSPLIAFAPRSPGVRSAERRAQTAKDVLGGWWALDSFSIKHKLRARHLIGYGASPVKITWNAKYNRPTWNVRDTIETYPNPDQVLEKQQPADVIFAYRRSVGWLKANGYGWALDQTSTRFGGSNKDDLMTILEYVDPEGCQQILTGYKNNDTANTWIDSFLFGSNAEVATTLECYPTYGVMTASVPTRISMSRPGGQFDTMVGMYHQQAKLMALEVIAVQKGIFPDTYLEGRPNEVPKFVEGPFDGRTGMINVVQGGNIRVMNEQPGYMTPQVIDRLERSQRVTAGLPAEFGGESGSNIRTGRRGDSVLSAVIDFPIAEAQEVLAEALVAENQAAIALARHYDGSATRSIYVGTGSTMHAVTYVAEQVFVNDEHAVYYPVSGTDMNGLLIGLGQRVGMGTMSKETAAEIDPFITSPEMEHDRIIAEGMEQALMSGIQQQAASGQMPPLVVAKVMSLIRSDKMELAEALNKVAEDAAKEQAAMAARQQAQQAGGPDALPPTADQMSAPAAAASMAGPDAAGMSPIPGVSPGQAGLSQLLTTLRRPVHTQVPTPNLAQGGM